MSNQREALTQLLIEACKPNIQIRWVDYPSFTELQILRGYPNYEFNIKIYNWIPANNGDIVFHMRSDSIVNKEIVNTISWGPIKRYSSQDNYEYMFKRIYAMLKEEQIDFLKFAYSI